MRVLIIANGMASADAIRHGLRHVPECTVLGFVDGSFPCADIVTDAAPDVVLIEELASRSTALRRIAEARGAAPGAKLVLLSVDMDAAWLGEASIAGIDAAISSATRPFAVGMLVREVSVGNVYHTFASASARSEASAAVNSLTAREHEILLLVAGGLTNSRIAAELWVTEQTVKFHLSNIYRKLDLGNRTEASNFAHVNGLVERAGSRHERAPVPVAA